MSESPNPPRPPLRLLLGIGGAFGLALLAALLLLPDPSFSQAPGSPFDNPAPDNSRPSAEGDPYPFPPELVGVDLLKQTEEAKQAKSVGCVACHQNTGDPHFKESLKIGCTDCHGGDASATDVAHAHVHPRHPEGWNNGSGNPARSYALLNHESPEFIRFVNPGDLRVAHVSCGTINCHPKEVLTNRKQIMSTGAMLWEAATYNNGTLPNKRAVLGECYAMNGAPLRMQTVPPPTPEEYWRKGVVPFLDPLPRFENSQPGNVLRIFERGGRFEPETGIPEREEEPGRPRTRLSERGLGTKNRTDPVTIGLNKTRLLDPMLWMLGTNDHPGDYRSAGCTACHVIYANDRSPVHSAQYHVYGNKGYSFQPDPSIPRDQPGHPVEHRFRNGIPSSQCMVCHVHPGTTVMNSYFGFMWWDEETNGEHMYPTVEKHPTPEQRFRDRMSNPDETASKGLWSDPGFLADLAPAVNPKADKTQFADFHGHGWVFRAVYKHDRSGRLLDVHGKPLSDVNPQKLAQALAVPMAEKAMYKEFDPSKRASYEVAELLKAEKELERKQAESGLPVHLLDIHLKKGMHCVDCHFVQDMHGNGRLHQEVRAATEIQCIDCHGTAEQYTTLRTSGVASYTSSADGKGRDLAAMRTPWGRKRFEKMGNRYFQNSMVEPNLRWEVVQTKDTIDPANPHYNEKSHLAKTAHVDEHGEMKWGTLPKKGKCAHANDNMSCITCHSSWNPSCFGCHLPQIAAAKMPNLHHEGDVSRNYTNYNFQTLRDDTYMLARDGDATGNRINPSRSSCAIHVGSYNINRESIYVQQQTISAEGMSGIAFSTNVPHTVSGRGTTKNCTDCHISPQNDNNAWMAQLLMHGTGFMNFIGRYAWVAAGAHGLEAVEVTEREEPQAVYGSRLHELAFPDSFKKFCDNGRYLETAHEHPGRDISEAFFKPLKETEVLQVQNRGEYLVAACGKSGIRAFDIAFVDNKAFAERITSAPVSPLGQFFRVKTADARAVAAPITTAPDPTRSHRPENREQAIHPMYAYIYVADKVEGLIVVGGVASTINGNPLDNFLTREVTFNPDGCLTGAINIAIVGTYAYICCDKGIVIVSLEDPKKPKIVNVLHEELEHPHFVTAQFRYAYVADEEGIKVLDITDPAKPEMKSKFRLKDVHAIYLARTYAYVAAGKHGLVILDISVPDHPKLDQIFDADGCINDLHDVKLGITYNTLFAYLADGKNGMRVVQLTGPEVPGNDGFSPRPQPRLIATRQLPRGGHALSLARGLDRDRAVDEAGNQTSVFGRVGARPMNLKEQQKLYLKPGGHGVWQFGDDPKDAYYQERYIGPPRAGEKPAAAPPEPAAGGR